MRDVRAHSASLSPDKYDTPGRPSCGYSQRREYSRRIGGAYLRPRSLRRGAAFFEDVIVNRIYGPKRFPSYIRARHTDSKCFFHADH
jgi:hypothetical protein